MGRIVIVAYKPKEGKAEALKELMKTHMPRLRAEGLVTDRESIIAEAADGTIVEVFEWLSDEAVRQAHENTNVRQMWGEYFAVCDCIPYGNVAEASLMFPGFKPLN